MRADHHHPKAASDSSAAGVITESPILADRDTFVSIKPAATPTLPPDPRIVGRVRLSVPS